jgi:hypothetical protein
VLGCILLTHQDHQTVICWPIKLPYGCPNLSAEARLATTTATSMEKLGMAGWGSSRSLAAGLARTTSSKSFSSQIRWHDLGTSGHGELELSSGQFLFNPSLRLFPVADEIHPSKLLRLLSAALCLFFTSLTALDAV